MKQYKNEKMSGKEVGKWLAESHRYQCFMDGHSVCTAEHGINPPYIVGGQNKLNTICMIPLFLFLYIFT